VAGEQHVIAGQVGAHANGHSFLSCRQMREPWNLTNACEALYLSLELSYAE
jgi:hypothetical protein